MIKMSSACPGTSLQGSSSASCLLGNCLVPIVQFQTITPGTATFTGGSTCSATFVVEVNKNVVAEFLQGQSVSISLSSNQFVEVYARLPATVSPCTADVYVCYTGQISGNIPPPSSGNLTLILILIIVILVLFLILLFLR